MTVRRGRVSATVVWWEGTGWEGRPFYLGKNKDTYDTEVYAIYKALKATGQRERGRQYTIFSDPASAVDCAR